jgi:hypothetical protein
MALTTTISTKELQRVAAAAYEGETLKVMLCQVALTGFTAESTVTQWQTTEISGNGYVRYSELIDPGEYNTTAGRYNLPVIDAEFTATGAGYNVRPHRAVHRWCDPPPQRHRGRSQHRAVGGANPDL